MREREREREKERERGGSVQMKGLGGCESRIYHPSK